jgi:hypothetical protein
LMQANLVNAARALERPHAEKLSHIFSHSGNGPDEPFFVS